jgi:hypothetical protein
MKEQHWAFLMLEEVWWKENFAESGSRLTMDHLSLPVSYNVTFLLVTSA